LIVLLAEWHSLRTQSEKHRISSLILPFFGGKISTISRLAAWLNKRVPPNVRSSMPLTINGVNPPASVKFSFLKGL
jgi:hypothetical protein